jgi:hypothetical protein
MTAANAAIISVCERVFNHDYPANHQYAAQDVRYSFASLEQAKPPLIHHIADQAQPFVVEYQLCIGVGFEVVDARPHIVAFDGPIRTPRRYVS